MMKTDQEQKTALPLKDSLSFIYAASILICVLITVVSIASLRYRVLLYPTEELTRNFVPNDVVNLSIGLPVLLGSMYLARGGKWIGLLCWTGALFFVFYNSMAYVFAMPPNWAFLAHLVLATLSMYTLIGMVVKINTSAVRQRLEAAVPEKFAGGVLAGLGLLFLLRVMVVIVNALRNGIGLPETDLAVNISDFLTTPAWIIGGILLWQRKGIGYVAGLGLLLQGSMLFVALIVFMILQSLLATAPIPLGDIFVVMAMGMFCFIPLGLFVRGVVTKHIPPQGDDNASAEYNNSEDIRKEGRA
jgi:hypothetical protein